MAKGLRDMYLIRSLPFGFDLLRRCFVISIISFARILEKRLVSYGPLDKLQEASLSDSFHICTSKWETQVERRCDSRHLHFCRELDRQQRSEQDETTPLKVRP